MPTLNYFSKPLVLLLAVWCLVHCTGCRVKAPIYVWRPPNISAPRQARIALAPISGHSRLAPAMQEALMQQRPAARADVALLTAEQLLQVSPVRLVSTHSLSNDLVALQAAKAAQAEFLLCGQVIECKLDLDSDADKPKPEVQNMNQVFFQRLGLQKSKTKDPGYYMVMSWNVLETQTGRSVGSCQVKVKSSDVAKNYPDLQGMSDQPAQQLIQASAREAWKVLSPFVCKDQVRLAVSWFQPGGFRVWRGVRAAKKGQWQIAESYWQSVADGLLPSPAAHHNLAIAKAAREDFSGAKAELQSATGIMSRRLPPETLVWLDFNHKMYNQAHQLGEPPEGWSFNNPYADLNPTDLSHVELSHVDSSKQGAVSNNGEIQLPYDPNP